MFDSYISANGTTWTKVAETTVAMGTNVTVGVAVTRPRQHQDRVGPVQERARHRLSDHDIPGPRTPTGVRGPGHVRHVPATTPGWRLQPPPAAAPSIATRRTRSPSSWQKKITPTVARTTPASTNGTAATTSVGYAARSSAWWYARPVAAAARRHASQMIRDACPIAPPVLRVERVGQVRQLRHAQLVRHPKCGGEQAVDQPGEREDVGLGLRWGHGVGSRAGQRR